MTIDAIMTELRELLAKGMEQPWEAKQDCFGGFISKGDTDEVITTSYFEQAKLICAAVNHVEALMDELERLREHKAKLKDRLARERAEWLQRHSDMKKGVERLMERNAKQSRELKMHREGIYK